MNRPESINFKTTVTLGSLLLFFVFVTGCELIDTTTENNDTGLVCSDPAPIAAVGDSGPFLHGEGVHRGSPAIIAWATSVAPEAGGYKPGIGAQRYTDPDCATGPASGISTDVLVLGDGGQVTLTFASPIVNAPEQADFAVYENGIADPNAGTVFAELAWVAVASRENATDDEFVRFPATTTRTDPVGGYDTGLEQIDPEQYSGFAGVHPAGTGTAFNLQELADHDLVRDEVVDLSAIRYIRIIDVIGDGSQLDDSVPQQPIYDPYPTYNPDITGNTAGFDLDGVAVLRNP